MSVTDELLSNAESYAATFDGGHLPLPPARHVAVVACMDARRSIRRIVEDQFIPVKSSVRGFVYDVQTGKLREVN